MPWVIANCSCRWQQIKIRVRAKAAHTRRGRTERNEIKLKFQLSLTDANCWKSMLLFNTMDKHSLTLFSIRPRSEKRQNRNTICSMNDEYNNENENGLRWKLFLSFRAKGYSTTDERMELAWAHAIVKNSHMNKYDDSEIQLFHWITQFTPWKCKRNYDGSVLFSFILHSTNHQNNTRSTRPND